MTLITAILKDIWRKILMNTNPNGTIIVKNHLSFFSAVFSTQIRLFNVPHTHQKPSAWAKRKRTLRSSFSSGSNAQRRLNVLPFAVDAPIALLPLLFHRFFRRRCTFRSQRATLRFTCQSCQRSPIFLLDIEAFKRILGNDPRSSESLGFLASCERLPIWTWPISQKPSPTWWCAPSLSAARYICTHVSWTTHDLAGGQQHDQRQTILHSIYDSKRFYMFFSFFFIFLFFKSALFDVFFYSPMLRPLFSSRCY